MNTPLIAGLAHAREATGCAAREHENRATRTTLTVKKERYARGGGPSGGEIQFMTAENDSRTRHEVNEGTSPLGIDAKTVGWPSSAVIAAVLASGELLRQRQSCVEVEW